MADVKPDPQRLRDARILILDLTDDMAGAASLADPVQRRRQQVMIARRLRVIANELDDNGRLVE